GRVARALALRERLFAQPYYRLIHAEADQLPGIVVDRFDDTLVVQPNAAWVEAHLDLLMAALIAQTGAKNLVKNASSRARTLEGLDEGSTTGLLMGAINGPLVVPMNGALYMADVLGGQKTGLFFDQRPNHAFFKGLAKDARVLDMFSHVGGFGLAALAGGAKSALCVDGSAPALSLAQMGAEKAGLCGLTVRQGDAFAVLEALAGQNEQFDLVVCDPPAFAPAKPALEAGLRAYERVARLAAPLVAQGGYLVLCSCSHAADLSSFRNACGRGIGRGGRRAQLLHTGFAGADHPILPQLAESGYLKALFYRLDG
ncbi:MAG: class I SAM-dependent methyltransferase, partial [Paracoccaceae bacterium]